LVDAQKAYDSLSATGLVPSLYQELQKIKGKRNLSGRLDHKYKSSSVKHPPRRHLKAAARLWQGQTSKHAELGTPRHRQGGRFSGE
jgi:hypothetical protein